MNTDHIFSKLHEHIDAADRSLRYIAIRSGVPYHRLYRFHIVQAPLPMADAEALYTYLTGKSFITTSDETDNAL